MTLTNFDYTNKTSFAEDTNLNTGAATGSYEWTVDRIEERRRRGGGFYTDYFQGCQEPYRMRLRVWIESYKLMVWLYIYASDEDSHLMWPFRADVTMKIVNQKGSSLNKNIVMSCEIGRPEKNSYSLSDNFKFYFADLTKANLLKGDCLTIICSTNKG